jgi:uncharacterized protein YfaA (DUF2138 family)
LEIHAMNRIVVRRCLAAGVVGIGMLAAYRTFGWTNMGPVNSLQLDMQHPDALVLTRSLAALPRDLLTIPLARDVLREDFVFYYEQSEDRLGIKGSLRRIAYEHELTWGDQLIRMVLDEPAEVAVWRDADGALRHYAIAVSRAKLARLLEEAAKVALKDTQLRSAGELRVDDDVVPVYALDYAYGRTMLFAAHGERMVILSHPGMLYGGKDGDNADATGEKVISSLLAADPRRQELFHDQFRLGAGIPDGHTIAVSADAVGLGYQGFFGALQALRFDFTRGRWQSQALVDGARLGKGGYDSRALWSALPYRPSGCFTVPADWKAMTPVLQRLGAKDGASFDALAAQFSGPAAACWYGGSRLYTPVFVARRTPPASAAAANAQLAQLFGALVRGAAEHSAQEGVQRWQRAVKTSEGTVTPTLAVSGDTIVFSADPALVDQVLAVTRKRAPAAADQLSDPAHTVGIIDPAALAKLAQKEAFEALPADTEAVFRGAAEAHLVPRLAALSKYPTYRLVMKTPAPTGASWQALEWQAAR